MRPCDSVAGTRCTRCTPPSYFRCAHTPCAGSVDDALDRDLHVLVAAEVGLVALEHLGLPALAMSAYCRYMRSRSAANRADSAPPSPPLISMITSRASSGSRGISRRRSFSCAAATLLFERRDLVGEGVVLRGEFARGLEVVGCRDPRVVRRDDLRQLGVAPVDPLGARGVGVHRGVGELLLDGLVLVDQPSTDSNIATRPDVGRLSGCCCRAAWLCTARRASGSTSASARGTRRSTASP